MLGCSCNSCTCQTALRWHSFHACRTAACPQRICFTGHSQEPPTSGSLPMLSVCPRRFRLQLLKVGQSGFGKGMVLATSSAERIRFGGSVMSLFPVCLPASETCPRALVSGLATPSFTPAAFLSRTVSAVLNLDEDGCTDSIRCLKSAESHSRVSCMPSMPTNKFDSLPQALASPASNPRCNAWGRSVSSFVRRTKPTTWTRCADARARGV